MRAQKAKLRIEWLFFEMGGEDDFLVDPSIQSHLSQVCKRLFR
jgi:hypothetical protein